MPAGFDRHWRLLALAWLLLGLTLPARAAPLEVLVVASDFSGPYAGVAFALSEELARAPAEPARVTRRTITQAGVGELASAGLVVALGSDALRHVLDVDARTPVLSLLVPRETYEAFVVGARRLSDRPVSAIFLDQPAARQIALVRQILAGKNRMALLGGAPDNATAKLLLSAARAAGLGARHLQVASEEEIFGALTTSLVDADALLVLPDPKLLNARTARGILLTAYRYQTPVIGYSESLVRAGAVAALWSTPAAMARQGAGMIQAWRGGGRWPAPAYPLEFEVESNDTVARSLDLRLRSIAEIKAAMQRQETRP